MNELEMKLSQFQWKLLKQEKISGMHAGKIYRIKVMDRNGTIRYLIYKELEKERKNEINIYKNLLPFIKSISPIVEIISNNPEAVIMEDLGVPLKKQFYKNKQAFLEKILEQLIFLHTDIGTRVTKLDIPYYRLSMEWYDWACSQLYRLSTIENLPYNSNWLEVVKYANLIMKVDKYSVKAPITLTHGDPHLENIFHFNQSIYFIDWEWASLSSPLRDLTIFLQDIYEESLIEYSKNKYYKLLCDHGMKMREDDYLSDFHYYYVDHTCMMLAWEIEKYLLGYNSQKEIIHILDFKTDQIKKTVARLS